METFAQVIDALGGSAVVARGIGEDPGTVRQMRRRGSIPSRYWPRIVVFAATRGRNDVTIDILAQISAGKVGEIPAPSIAQDAAA